jgi:hypothetical protein
VANRIGHGQHPRPVVVDESEPADGGAVDQLLANRGNSSNVFAPSPPTIRSPMEIGIGLPNAIQDVDRDPLLGHYYAWLEDYMAQIEHPEQVDLLAGAVGK